MIDIFETSNKYDVIYADPAWSYTDKRTKPGPSGNFGASAERHYQTMSVADIKALPVANVSADTALLFIWCTFPLMPIWNDVIEAWGFKYKTLGFSWAKTNRKSGTLAIGAGSYTRSNSEVCLIGVRGKGASLIQDHSICNTVLAPREEHSRKPAIFREKIEQLVGPNTKKLEMFARTSAPGWDVWGNEVTKFT